MSLASWTLFVVKILGVEIKDGGWPLREVVHSSVVVGRRTMGLVRVNQSYEGFQ